MPQSKLPPRSRNYFGTSGRQSANYDPSSAKFRVPRESADWRASAGDGAAVPGRLPCHVAIGVRSAPQASAAQSFRHALSFLWPPDARRRRLDGEHLAGSQPFHHLRKAMPFGRHYE